MKVFRLISPRHHDGSKDPKEHHRKQHDKERLSPAGEDSADKENAVSPSSLAGSYSVNTDRTLNKGTHLQKPVNDVQPKPLTVATLLPPTSPRTTDAHATDEPRRPVTPTTRGPGSKHPASKLHPTAPDDNQAPDRAEAVDGAGQRAAGPKVLDKGEQREDLHHSRRQKRTKRTVKMVTTRRVSRERKPSLEAKHQDVHAREEEGPPVPSHTLRPRLPLSEVNYNVTTTRLRNDEGTDLSGYRSRQEALGTLKTGTQSSTGRRGDGTNLCSEDIFQRGLHKYSTSPSPTRPEVPARPAVALPVEAPVATVERLEETPERVYAPGYAKTSRTGKQGGERHQNVTSVRDSNAPSVHAYPPSTVPDPHSQKPSVTVHTRTSTSAGMEPYGTDSAHGPDSYLLRRYARALVAPLETSLASPDKRGEGQRTHKDGSCSLPTCMAEGGLSLAQSRGKRVLHLHHQTGENVNHQTPPYTPSTDRMFSVDPSSQSGPVPAGRSSTHRDPAKPMEGSGNGSRLHKQQELLHFLQSRRSCSTLCPGTATDLVASAGWDRHDVVAHQISDRTDADRNTGAHLLRREPAVPLRVCVKVFNATAFPSSMTGPGDTRKAFGVADPHGRGSVTEAEPMFLLHLSERLDLRRTACSDVLEQLHDRLHYLLPAASRLEGQLFLDPRDSSAMPELTALLRAPLCGVRVALMPDTHLSELFHVERAGTKDTTSRDHYPRVHSSEATEDGCPTLVLRWHALYPVVLSVAQRLLLERDGSPELSTASASGSRQLLRVRSLEKDSRCDADTGAHSLNGALMQAEHLTPTLSRPWHADPTQGPFPRSEARPSHPFSSCAAERVFNPIDEVSSGSENSFTSGSDNSVEVIRMSAAPSWDHGETRERFVISTQQPDAAQPEPRVMQRREKVAPDDVRLVDHLVERCEESTIGSSLRYAHAPNPLLPHGFHHGWNAVTRENLFAQRAALETRTPRTTSYSARNSRVTAAAAPEFAPPSRCSLHHPSTASSSGRVTYLYDNSSKW